LFNAKLYPYIARTNYILMRW